MPKPIKRACKNNFGLFPWVGLRCVAALNKWAATQRGPT